MFSVKDRPPAVLVQLIPLVAKLSLSNNLKCFLVYLPLGASVGALLPLAAHQFNEVKKLTTVTFTIS